MTTKQNLSILILTCLLPACDLAAQGPYRRAIDDPLGQQCSQVYDIHGEYAVRGIKVYTPGIRKIIDQGIKQLAGQNDLAQAWRAFIHDQDIIALKFTSANQHRLGTNTPLAQAILESLYEAGFKPQQIMLVGLEELPPNGLDTIPCPYGWTPNKADFISDTDYLSAWIDQVTAIINVPTFLEDPLFGLRGAMVNITFPLLKSPARLYPHINQRQGNLGDPFVADLYTLPQVQGKIRLHIGNTLRMPYYIQHDIEMAFVIERSRLLFSTDPVAMDKVALELINRERHNRYLPEGMPLKIQAPYLKTAQAAGLGYEDLNYIEYLTIKHNQ